MKAFSSPFLAALQGDTTYLTWLLTITAKDGSGDVYRLTSDNKDFVGSQTWKANPGFSISSLRVSTGEQAAIAEVTIGVDDETTEISKADVIAGKFKRARANVYIGLHNQPGVTPQLVLKGFIGDIQYTNAGVVVMEIGTRWRESRSIMVDTFAKECRWRLGEPRCGVDLSLGAGYTITATVASVAGRDSFTIDYSDGRADESNWFTHGALKFTSGANEGDAYDIRRWISGTARVLLWLPAGKVVEVGDTMEIHPGCNKRTGLKGCARFDNIPNFGGFPFLTAPDFNFGDAVINEQMDEGE